MILSRNELVALLAHASVDETRPHVCCLHVIPGLRIEATDGHRGAQLIVGTEATGSGFLVPRSALVKILKILGPKDSVEFGNGTLCAGAVVVDFARSDASFPPLDQVIPPRDADSIGGHVHVNGAYFADLGLIAKAAETRSKGKRSDRDVSSLVIYPPFTPLDPILVTCEDPARGRSWRVTIMPRRAGTDDRSEAERRNAMRKMLKIEDREPTKIPGIKVARAR